MRIVLALWALFAWLPAPQPAAASRPVHAVITGCVQGGVFVSEYTEFGTHVSPGGYRISLLTEPGSPVDLQPFEGRRVSVTGELLPGDVFLVEEESLVDRGPCGGAMGDAGEPEWMPGDASGEGVRFVDPKVDGMPLDYCLEWGSGCGKPAADAWCRARGFAAASVFEVRTGSPPTRILSSGQICDMVFCDRIISLTCVGGGRGNRSTGGTGQE